MARARGSLHDMGLWRRRSLTIPPDSPQAWIQLAVWEIWMGTLICVILGFGVTLIATAPDRIYKMEDISRCYAPPPVTLPCERILYGGALNAAFTVLFGVMLMVAATWFLWELWSAVEPKPITDDFLELLNDSFGRSWRKPTTWPWARVVWAYGFTSAGALLTAGVALTIWMLVAPASQTTPPSAHVETSQRFTVP